MNTALTRRAATSQVVVHYAACRRRERLGNWLALIALLALGIV